MIEGEYMARCQQPSDIVDHLPRLLELARNHKHITEFGVHVGNSTVAFLAARPKVLVSYDTRTYLDPDKFRQFAKYADVDWQFRLANVLEIEIESTDLLLIDSWHHYHQLKAEFELHAGKVRHQMVLHDTETNGQEGSGGHPGMWPAVEELCHEGEWKIEKHWPECNGLTLLRRIKPHQQRPISTELVEKAKQLSCPRFGHGDRLH